MRNISYIFFIALLSLLIGCSTAYVEKYVPKKVGDDPDVIVKKTYWNEVIYKKGEYEFFPRFYTLSRSYSNPGALLVVSSSVRKSIFLESVVLESADKTHRDTVEFSQETMLDRRNEKEGLNYASLPVFEIDETELTKYWESGDIRVIVNYRVGGKKESLIFEFELRKGREIVWPT
ncbi:hypothetical protein SAMN02745866_04222 [Alteromonadaceae bacterium Bs31]|nr:hypothetical protein SAMN02745866_04222 [Alteromonadaceae bacterium Bs31]